MSRSKNPSTLQMPVSELAGRITTIIETARKRVQSVVDHEMVRAYWEIGREITDLPQRHGRGFTASNLLAMRRFYLSFPIQHALRTELA